jgi:hypothetical protein
VTAGTAATYRVRTAVVSGSPEPIALTASGGPPGTSVSFSPNPVTPGGESTMTVTTAPAARNGAYALTIQGMDPTATQYASVGLTVTGGTELRIADLAVADTTNAADWSVQANLQPGDLVYGDRTFTVATVPPALQGADWIRTANDSKTSTVDPLVTFTINESATVAVAVDTRLGRRTWMDASWVDTGTQLTDTEGSNTRRFEVYQKAFPAGRVALGPNADTANSASMYTIIVL